MTGNDDSSDDEQVNQNRLAGSLKYFTALEENVNKNIYCRNKPN